MNNVFKDVGLSPEQIQESISEATTFLKELTGYGKPVSVLLKKLGETLEEAKKLRAPTKPDAPAWLGYDLKGRAVGVEQTLQGLLEYVEGVDQRQRKVFCGKYKRLRKAYSAGGKTGWMERFLAAIAADMCAEGRKIKRRGKSKNSVAADIFRLLGYDLNEGSRNPEDAFRKLLNDRAKPDMKEDPLGLKALCLKRMADDINAKTGSKSSVD